MSCLPASVDTLAVWEDQLELLREGGEAGRGVAAGRQQDLGVPLSSLGVPTHGTQAIEI